MEWKWIGDIAVVDFVDRKILTEENIHSIGAGLFKLVDEVGCKKVLINFKNVDFMSSAAFGKFMAMQNKLKDVEGKLVLCQISKNILEGFKILKLDQRFTIVDSEQQGLQSF